MSKSYTRFILASASQKAPIQRIMQTYGSQRTNVSKGTICLLNLIHQDLYDEYHTNESRRNKFILSYLQVLNRCAPYIEFDHILKGNICIYLLFGPSCKYQLSDITWQTFCYRNQNETSNKFSDIHHVKYCLNTCPEGNSGCANTDDKCSRDHDIRRMICHGTASVYFRSPKQGQQYYFIFLIGNHAQSGFMAPHNSRAENQLLYGQIMRSSNYQPLFYLPLVESLCVMNFLNEIERIRFVLFKNIQIFCGHW